MNFFKFLANDIDGNFIIVSIRDQKGKLIGFVLIGLSSNSANAYLLGLDYEYSRELSLYYSLIWKSMGLAINSGKDEVDLGVSSYFIKQGLGADLIKSDLMAKFASPVLHSTLGWLLPTILAFDQPVERNTGNVSNEVKV